MIVRGAVEIWRLEGRDGRKKSGGERGDEGLEDGDEANKEGDDGDKKEL